ncbi:GyrI-like domain-containing protein [Fluviicola taffensis]|uniref:Transcription activator effector binding protein n=1 Tax=Fluviicola taffensis (strain DSM 16823 / NCIMB 13979 / RW262) TaxID=755732 RepID=F2IIV7_FLUTR|nr:GyrI-like domain-containing protein [Fluviicola taffensis]AEA42814.1 transcription activator effector binding protein [Fluviicola taffensis DSM 16823]
MIQQKGFKIIGISVETSNQGGEASSAIGALWGQFISENLLSKIPNQLDSDILCIYTNYESDYTGKYTCFLGVKVSSLEKIPEGLVGQEFEGGKFQPFLAQGEFPQAIVDTWQSIWDQDKSLNRSYTYDYEVYDDKSRQGEESEAAIFIAIN